ncbi:MBL fold metallo-hydrolase [Nocardia tengchongensis]|uniref:MBL fold metallo-hydrolase n=1 Tax=Nocardia tengchongensis TaxID=2055889 RepID=A0ABX8CPQ7_9NOCA|nr:alkyl sulfatase dimerization domain-containing protein [Nocardia tengchongensis]QVI21554.1 MBL fold metallo-hydrolase [Nocardia tengchongensis]
MTAAPVDRTDFDNAERGFIARLSPAVIPGKNGGVAYDADSFDFLKGDGADTVLPSLWRQSQLVAMHGLYEVCEGVYQVRGLDISNMTLIESDTGVIVIDPLVSAETAAAALALYRENRGDRAVTAVIYTHPHADHFGGVLGVVDPDTTVPIIAPEHFMEHAISENVYAGTAMLRRGMYYSGANLARDPKGLVGMGLGPVASAGEFGLLAPTLNITATGQEEVIDGVRFIFQMTPGTEAPAEMNFLLPDRNALCMAENACHTLHNILTLRGAQVRDARMWSRYIAEAIEMFIDRADVVFASHHWPTWGRDNIEEFLTQQRDTYAYMHDQTLRRMNQGEVGSEIAEDFPLAPELAAQWNNRGYYGSISHDVKAVYQRYVGWYDANPAHLWMHPPQEQATRYVKLLGGVDATVAKVKEFADQGDLRFAAELGGHAVFADPSHAEAKQTLAAVFERLGFGSENATWRNCFLTAAQELMQGVAPTAIAASQAVALAMSITQLFDTLSLNIVGSKAWDEKFSIAWHFTDSGENYRMELSHGALIHHPAARKREADLDVTLTKLGLLQLIATGKFDGLQTKGDTGVWQRLTGLLDKSDPNFAIITP